MPLDLYQLSQQCSPQVTPSTMITLIKTESRANHLAIGLNGYRLRFQPRTESQARAWIKYLAQHNYNFDVGLTQVNIKNIRKYGYQPEQLLNPCLNIKLGGQILTQNYLQAQKTTPDPQLALRRALSMYNTGTSYRGFSNGYLTRILANL